MHRFGVGRLVGMAVGAAAATTVVAHCSSSWSPSSPSGLPETSFPKWDYNWDKREAYSLVKPPKQSKKGTEGESKSLGEEMERKKCRATRHLVLIRHGQYNLKGETDKERGLTPLGEEQAALAGQRLKKAAIPFTTLIVSNMTRALQTAQIILKELGQPGLELPCGDPLLREGSPCLPDPPISSWRPDLYYYEDGARIEAAFRKYFHRADPEQLDDSYEVIVCHANVIRYFVCRAMQFPPEAWLRISLNHTSLTMLSILPSGRVVLRSLGDSGHLPAEKMTTS